MGRQIEELRIELESIGHALADNVLQVPIYQRSYAWEEVHIRDLYQDITTALSAKEKDYFVGSIVVTKGTDVELEVVDGQQRLASIAILVGAMRDWLFSNGDPKRAAQLEQKYLVNVDFRTQERKGRLCLNEIDHDFFHKRVLSSPESPDREEKPTKESHRRIACAIGLANAHVQHWVGTSSDKVARLGELKDYIDEHVRVIWVRVPDDANAFIIFETLNDRGLDLAISDLLKNFLFRLSEDRLSEVKQSWVEMLATLDAVQNEGIVVEFIRHLWSSKYGATRQKELYSEIKKETSSKQSAVDFAKELAIGAKMYAAILNTDHALWQQYGATAKGHMATINSLGMVQIRPLLLATLAKFNEKEITATLRLMVSWSVRLIIAGGLGGGTMEKHYADAAKAVRDGVIRNSKQLSTTLATVVPRDSEFEAALQVARVTKAPFARYYLQVLERQFTGEKQPELVPNANQEEVNLEHILPRKPDKSWSTFNDEEIAAFHNRLGNLALLAVGVNSGLGNSSFEDKKPILAASSFKLTKIAGKPKSWTSKEIEDRQKKLAELGVKAWPLV
ncbi:MAG TPA: DUF262 domain-containing protein [Myxococcota bacterium]|nr:DUF262 domain-containing protein [Myxococcota bacterium]HRY93671.1 DUF262 domain-containing protein [Myxococcota bacterium]